MDWKCKICAAVFSKRVQLLEHYRLRHNTITASSPLPCLYQACICTFQSLNALKIHLTRIHSEVVVDNRNQTQHVSFLCPVCDKTLLCHLRMHLKGNETVNCPFKNCNYSTNSYTSFSTHKSRNHLSTNVADFKDSIIVREATSSPFPYELDSDRAGSSQNYAEVCSSESTLPEPQCDIAELQSQLKNNLASLFLKMHSILHVSERATQDIVESLGSIFLLSRPLVKNAVETVLKEHNQPISEDVLSQLVEAIMKSNVLLSATAQGEELSTTKRRKTFVRSHYPLVMPVEYTLDTKEHTAVYVPILQMVQVMFNHTDILAKIRESKHSQGMYVSHEDGAYFKENQLLSAVDELKLSLILYVDDIELANPLGTARKNHKLCAVYWLLGNLPSQYRSSLHVIQLALLCKVSDVRRCGYETVLAPLLKDLQILEQDGIFIEALGRCIKGTVFCVAADNLAAHGLAGFVQSFRGPYICRFCCGTSEEIQTAEVSQGQFCKRTKDIHDLHVQSITRGDSVTYFGVTGDCCLRKALQYFHPITGFPPDILHDLFEGIVPIEMALCIRQMIQNKYFTLDHLNAKIKAFPYEHYDRLDKPQTIPKTFATKLSIGGNGHEKATLLRLLPLMIGNKVPERDGAWAILMDLKEITQLVLCPSFTDSSLQYLQTKIIEHRQCLKEVFPDFRIRPKHHYLEHYPDLIRQFGPLVHLWTMRFEGKHSFIKKVIHDTQNFKNVSKTLANRHQHMMAYYLNAPSFFKPHTEASTVTSILVSSLDQVAKDYIAARTDCQIIYSTTKVSVDGTDYLKGMFVSAGKHGGLPTFSRIENILLVNDNVAFVCRNHESWYCEHLRSFEVISLDTVSVFDVSQLNDKVSLNGYIIGGRLMLKAKRFILTIRS